MEQQVLADLAPEQFPVMEQCLARNRADRSAGRDAAILRRRPAPVAAISITAFQAAIAGLRIEAPLLLTQNGGTLRNADWAARYPVLDAASAPTASSMRGAAALSGLTDAMVIDIGGTTSDVGALTHGFPREASVAVDVGGVRTNFRMPDVYSFGLGGGSLVAAAVDDRKASASG
ncbi:hypothetical protein ABVK25_012429 [Lepraria finkii]|uniref:Hydantoinase A/oxoprolinase domain-containing protein n=1 Tax=Lepraria finkii TaxID=1340010 RepID=A0ABR4AFC2_9LECA